MNFKVIITICIVFLTNLFSISQNSSSQMPSSIKTEKDFLVFLNDSEKQSKFNNKKEYLDFLQTTQTQFENLTTNQSIEINYKIAQELYDDNQLNLAYKYIDKVSSILEQRSEEPHLEILIPFYNLQGVFYYQFNRFKEAKEVLNKTIRISDNSPKIKINALNTLGLIYSQESNYDEAISYYNQSLTIAEEIGSEEWTGIIKGNLGMIYFLNHDYSKAKELLLKDQTISIRNNEKESALGSTSALLRIAILEENRDEIIRNNTIFDSLAIELNDLFSLRNYHFTKAHYFEYFKDYENALKEFKLLQEYRDSLDSKYNKANLENMIFQIEFEKEKNKNQLILEKTKRRNQFIFSAALLLLISTLACILIIILLRRRKNMQQQLLQIRNERIKTNLERNQKELHRVLDNIVEKNKLISILEAEIRTKDELNEKLNLQEKNQELNEQIRSFTIVTKNDLTKFREIFIKIHPLFLENLVKKNQSLTSAETRMAMLIKLNLTLEEMANILAISEDSVRRTNLRLRNKLELEEQSELIEFIAEL